MSYGPGPKGTATAYHARLVRSRGACQRCGKTYGLQCAHIVRRHRSATRTDENNGWCLCAGCHGIVDTNAAEFMRLVEQTIGVEAFEGLVAKANANLKPWTQAMWKAETARLKALLAEVSA